MEQLIIKDRVISKDIIDILYDIKRVCNNGKLSQFKISGSGIAVTCPVHNGGQEKHPSCYINLQNEDVPYGFYHCFTCGSKGPFSRFVGECFNKNEEYGENWLLSNYASDYIKRDLILPKIEKKKEETFLDESVLDKFESYHPYMTQRKLTDEVIKMFKIKYDPDTQCIVFPVRDRYGRLKYLTRRSIVGKRFIIDSLASKGDIFGLSEVLKRNCKSVIVCESQINCLTAWSYGYPAIALLGAGTTKEQMNELNNTSVMNWILAYDPDDAGRKGTERFLNLVRKGVYIDKINFPEGKDLNDLSREQFEISLQNRERII